MKHLITRNKIRGVTFHRSTTTQTKYDPAGPAWLIPAELQREITRSLPAPLDRHDLHRLLQDNDRQELQSLVSDAIEQCGRWRQIVHRLERTLSSASPARDTPWSENVSPFEPPPLPDDAALLIASRHVQRLWRHRLDILELIAEGQSTHQFEMVYFSRTRMGSRQFK